MARPNLSYLKNLLLFLFGLPCGIVTGLTGLGTSVMVLPLLRFLVALRGSRAAGTALAITVFAALTGILSYGQRGLVFWGLGVVLAVGQVAGAVAAQRLTVDRSRLMGSGAMWAVLVIGCGGGMTAQALGLIPGSIPGWGGALLSSLPHAGAAFWLTAAVAAILVGLISRLSLMGGVLLVPAEIYLLHVAPRPAQGTALFVLLLAALPSVVIHARRADLEPQSATWMSVGAVFGALVGAFYASAVLPPALLVLIYGVFLTLIGFSLLWRRDTPRASLEEKQ